MLRYNEGKRQLSLVPVSFFRSLPEGFSVEMLEDITKVLEYGSQKYSAHNWRTGGSWSKVADSALRHLVKIVSGEYYDEESELPHLAHFGCNLLFLIQFASEADRPNDDRLLVARPPLLLNYPSPWNLLIQFASWVDGGSDAELHHCVTLLNGIYDDAE